MKKNENKMLFTTKCMKFTVIENNKQKSHLK